MVSTAILRSYLLTSCPKSSEHLCEHLSEHLCVLNHPSTGSITLLVHQLLRSEREEDCLLQQLNFFTAGHHHCARYITQHILEMRYLLAETELMSGAFVYNLKHTSLAFFKLIAENFNSKSTAKICY